jgi:hypothetical protein
MQTHMPCPLFTVLLMSNFLNYTVITDQSLNDLQLAFANSQTFCDKKLKDAFKMQTDITIYTTVLQ